MLIRDALVSTDRAALAALLDDTPEFSPDEVETALELIDEMLNDPDTTYQILLAVDDEAEAAGQVLGYICYGRTPMTRATVDLYWLAVSRSARRRAVGRTLCAALEARLAASSVWTIRVETGTRSAYAPTIAFYRSIGYAESGRIHDFYDAGDDLLILTRDLREYADAR